MNNHKFSVIWRALYRAATLGSPLNQATSCDVLVEIHLFILGFLHMNDATDLVPSYHLYGVS